MIPDAADRLQGMAGDRREPIKWRSVGDAVLFGIGAAGAAWEIFVDQTSNYYVFALIVALLRLGSGLLDKAREALGK